MSNRQSRARKRALKDKVLEAKRNEKKLVYSIKKLV